MSAGFTPGPWHVSKRNLRRVVSQKGMITTAYHSNNGLGVTPAQASELTTAFANARLIAAAPELYAALEEAANLCVNTFAEGGSAHKRMLAALDKARGDT